VGIKNIKPKTINLNFSSFKDISEILAKSMLINIYAGCFSQPAVDQTFFLDKTYNEAQ